MGEAHDDLTPADTLRIRAHFEKDLATLREWDQITPLDEAVYRSVFPIVPPHYVSYANPNFGSYEEAFRVMGA